MPDRYLRKLFQFGTDYDIFRYCSKNMSHFSEKFLIKGSSLH